MSFTSDVFKVKDLARFAKFCELVGVQYEDIGNNKVVLFSDSLIEPPSSYTFNGAEYDMDFDAELHKLAEIPVDQPITYRVEYEVGIHSNGEVEYWCEDMVGMPQGDSNEKAIGNTGRVWN